MRTFQLLDLGLCSYQEAYAKQLDLVEKKKCGKVSEDYLIFVEHPEVYTYGRKSKDPLPDHLQNSVAVERGGEATFHNPGQLVAYPILKLQPGEQDAHLHLRRLEDVAIATLKKYGIIGERRNGATGVWISEKEKKIASIGIAISGWVTYHGIALNVCNDLAGFYKINPCGYHGDVMTSMREELGVEKISMLDVKSNFFDNFSAVFK